MQEHREGNYVRNNTLQALTKSQQHKSAVIKDNSGNILMESTAVLNWWTESLRAYTNYKLYPNTSRLHSNQIPTQQAESLPVLREEAEEAVHSLKEEKSPRVGNIPSELLKNGGKAPTIILTARCKKMWETKEWPKEWTQLLVIPSPKNGYTSSNDRILVPSA